MCSALEVNTTLTSLHSAVSHTQTQYIFRLGSSIVIIDTTIHSLSLRPSPIYNQVGLSDVINNRTGKGCQLKQPHEVDEVPHSNRNCLLGYHSLIRFLNLYSWPKNCGACVEGPCSNVHKTLSSYTIFL